MSATIPLAYTIEGAAAATPLSQALIRDAINQGELVVHYRRGGEHPLILAEDLIDWIRTLPTEKRSA